MVWYGMVWNGLVWFRFAVLNLFWWYFPVGKHLAISHFEMVCTVNAGRRAKHVCRTFVKTNEMAMEKLLKTSY